MAFVEKPEFPDVPNLPGVPQLPRESVPQAQIPETPIVDLGAPIQMLALSITAPPRWGIYTYPVATAFTNEASALVIEPTSIYRMGHTQEYSLPTNPVQMGSFSNYNKVGTPYEIELRMTKTGSLSDRAFFLDDLERISATTQLFRVVTPERTYQPVNITGFQIVREGAKGAYFFAEVDVRLREIRQVYAQYSSTGGKESTTENAKEPSSLPTTNMGNMNTITPDSQTQIKVESALDPFLAVPNLYTN